MRLCYKHTDAMLYLFWHQTPFCFPHTAVIIIGSQTPRALSTTAAFSFLPGCISNRGGIAVCVPWVTCGHAWLAHDITLWWFTLLALSLSLSSGGTASKNFYNHQSAAATFHSGSFPPPALLTCTCAFTIFSGLRSIVHAMWHNVLFVRSSGWTLLP